MTYDAADGYVLLLNYDPLGTWEYRAGIWTQLAPTTEPVIADQATMPMTYDSTDGYVLLFGGYCSSSDLQCNQTWKFSQGQWTLLSPSSSPPSGISAVMTDDPVDSEVLLFGASSITEHGFIISQNDTWGYSGGEWQNQTSVPSPGAAGYGAGLNTALTFDLADNVSILYVPQGESYTILDSTWEWSSHPLTPPPLSITAAPVSHAIDASTTSALGSVVVSGGYAQSLAPFYTTSVSFGDGDSEYDVPLSLNYSTTSNYTQYLSGPIRHAYASAGNYTVEVWANDSTHLSAHVTWVVNVSAFSVRLYSSNDTPIMGQPILINASVRGGYGPFNYSYTGLPFGCYSVNSSSIGCLPTQAGNFTANVVVKDVVGGTTNASLRIQVVFGFTVSGPSSAVENVPFTVSLQVPPNVGSVRYAYVGLPAGCRSVDAPELNCTPTSVGTYTIGISVISSVYGGAHRSLTVRVMSPVPVLFGVIGYTGLALIGGLAGGLTAIAAGWLIDRRSPIGRRP